MRLIYHTIYQTCFEAGQNLSFLPPPLPQKTGKSHVTSPFSNSKLKTGTKNLLNNGNKMGAPVFLPIFVNGIFLGVPIKMAFQRNGRYLMISPHQKAGEPPINRKAADRKPKVEEEETPPVLDFEVHWLGAEVYGP